MGEIYNEKQENIDNPEDLELKAPLQQSEIWGESDKNAAIITADELFAELYPDIDIYDAIREYNPDDILEGEVILSIIPVPELRDGELDLEEFYKNNKRFLMGGFDTFIDAALDFMRKYQSRYGVMPTKQYFFENFAKGKGGGKSHVSGHYHKRSLERTDRGRVRTKRNTRKRK